MSTTVLSLNVQNKLSIEAKGEGLPVLVSYLVWITTSQCLCYDIMCWCNDQVIPDVSNMIKLFHLQEQNIILLPEPLWRVRRFMWKAKFFPQASVLGSIAQRDSFHISWLVDWCGSCRRFEGNPIGFREYQVLSVLVWGCCSVSDPLLAWCGQGGPEWLQQLQGHPGLWFSPWPRRSAGPAKFL